MASGHSKRGGGDRVLESRHLIGLFLGVVLLCCVFFTLGYVMGKTQYGNAPVEAASIDKTPQAVTPRGAQRAAPSQASPEWDFYARKKTAEVPLKPAPASSHVAESASAAAPPLLEMFLRLLLYVFLRVSATKPRLQRAAPLQLCRRGFARREFRRTR